MAIYKRCNFCHGLYQGRCCSACANKHSKKRQENNEALKLYGSGRWRKCRRDIRIKYQDIDIWELGAGNVSLIRGTVYVHHIIERDARPDLLFDMDNLITVSADSHEQIHAMYKTDRVAALARIQKGIDKFEEMYNT